MQTSRIKNIVITILLLLNIFFLVIYIRNSAYEQVEERQMLEGIRTLLAENNIELLPDAIEKQNTLQVLTGKISAEAEEEIALALIGGHEKLTDNGTVYSGSGGTVHFRGGGEFSAEISSTVQSKNIEIDAKDRIRNMGITAEILSVEENSVNAVCVFSGAKIFNCVISFNYENGVLYSVSGRYVSKVAVAENKQSEKLVDASTALMKLLEMKMETGDNITEVINVSSGYIMSVSVFGDVELYAAFRITTNAGDYYINSKTGKVEFL